MYTSSRLFSRQEWSDNTSIAIVWTDVCPVELLVVRSGRSTTPLTQQADVARTALSRIGLRECFVAPFSEEVQPVERCATICQDVLPYYEGTHLSSYAEKVLVLASYLA